MNGGSLLYLTFREIGVANSSEFPNQFTVITV